MQTTTTNHELNKSYKPKHVAPAFGKTATEDFPMEAMIRHLDGEEDEDVKDDSSHVDAAEVIQMLLKWISASKARDTRAIAFVGKRAIAAAWVINPDLFGGAPGHMVAKSFGISHMKFSWMTAEFSREFGVRNRFQDHDGKAKK